MIQSILFDKSLYNKKQVNKFLTKHHFTKAYGIDETKKYYRVRQIPPISDYDYKTKQIKKGIKLILMYEKGGSIQTKAYQLLMNKYRQNFCPKISKQLEDGEIHAFCANYEGPGTNINYNLKHNIKPINNVDNCAKQHDIKYNQAKSLKDIKEADKIFLDCIKPYKSEHPYYEIGKLGIESKKIPDAIPLLNNYLFKLYTSRR